MRAALIRAIVSQPELTRFGFNKAASHSEFLASLTTADVGFFDVCCLWLGQFEPSHRINYRHTALTLKHMVVEAYSAPQGLFIAAAVSLDIRFERSGPHVYFAIRGRRPRPFPYHMLRSQIMDASPVPPLMPAAPTASLLAISKRKLWALTASGEIKCVRIGRSVRYDPADLRAWIDARKSGGVMG